MKPVANENPGDDVPLIQVPTEQTLGAASRPDTVMPPRAGHVRAVAYMRTPEFRHIVSLLDAHRDTGAVYFRPIDRGVCAVDLHPASAKPRIGLGKDPVIRCGWTTEDLEPFLASRIAQLIDARERQTCGSAENRLEARLISAALRAGLTIPGFPPDLRFIHSQWRLDLVDEAGQAARRFTDLIAIDLNSRRLVIIELKAFRDRSAGGQAARYREAFETNAEQLLPFFESVAQMMGELYGCPELSRLQLAHEAIDALVAWPSPDNASAGEALTVQEVARPAGPQSKGDAPFTARMRLHQSWYRSEVLRLPHGTDPGAKPLGSMLTAAGARSGANFVHPAAFRQAKARIEDGAGVEPFRCLRNMLSSQPMCFNLFGPLAEDRTLATACFRRLLPGEVDKVVSLKFEYAPAPRSEYLDDRTSFDAFVEYLRPDGARAFIGIETKLTEPFSRKNPDAEGYRRHLAVRPDLWRADKLADLGNRRWFQLWRNHMLAERLRSHPRWGYQRGLVMVVHHPGDDDCRQAVAGYRALLPTEQGDLVEAPIDRLLTAWASCMITNVDRSWLSELRVRYLDLDRSAHLLSRPR
jgi:hypothetical protein